MKKLLFFISLITAFFTHPCFSKIYIDLELEKQMRHECLLFKEACKKSEMLLNQNFPTTKIAEIYENNLSHIPLGSINNESYYQEVWNITHQIIAEIEHYDDYQNALKKALVENTDEAWNSLIHEIVYYHTRVLTQKKSDLIFPSLEYNDTTQIEKIKRFCVANCAIDSQKNAPFLEATALILYTFKQLRKNNQSKEV